ncbi:type I-E CRISPR-associated protein Cse1/CasA [bacterium]|nr:type I-E CRISPR-associated protein Cse1/CasA [bacterium]
MKNSFNLVSQPWIPVAGKGLVSLTDIFTDSKITALGGNPIQKIAMTKLLLAIVQAAWTPKDDKDWKKNGLSGMAKKAMNYLTKNKGLFWLYGKEPFLQMSGIKKAALQTYGAVQIDVASGNTTVLIQSQVEQQLTDADKALLLVQQMGFSLGGKKTDNSIVLSPNYAGKSNAKDKPSTGKPGPSLGFLGYLHSFLLGTSLQETLWMNIFTEEDMQDLKYFSEGIGVAPWEKMPRGEDCRIARALKKSYMGRLVPLSRFVFLADKGLHYSEGIAHPGHLESIVDPTVAIDRLRAKPKVIWVDPERRPWRQLTALLSFFENDRGFECLQLRIAISRIDNKKCQPFSIWSGGIKVKSTAGEQDVKGMNDFVESEIILNSEVMGEELFVWLKLEMEGLDKLSKSAYGSVMGFFKEQKTEGKDQGAQAANLFWQLCEHKFQELVNACNETSGKERKKLRSIFAGFVNKAYNTYCPKDTARQINAWAANRPNLGEYLS